MSEIKRILVCGYYGFANTGDEAILTALLADLRAAHPGATVTVLAGRPSAVTGDYGVDAVHWQDIPSMIAAARDADLMVLGGGGLFQDYHGFDAGQILTPAHGAIGYYGGFALLASLVDTPLVIYAVGVGPLSTEEGTRFTRIAFDHAAAASVRDQASLEVLAQAGVDPERVSVTADPAWLVEPATGEVFESILELEEVPVAPRTVAVAVRPWGDDFGWAAELGPALDQLISELDARVLFVPFQDSPHPHENDAHAALQVLRQMERLDRAAIVRGRYSVEERMALIAGANLLVGMRLHAVIFGMSTSVPTVALSYDPKVASTMGELDRDQLVIPLEEVSTGRVLDTARTALDAPPSPQVAAIKQRARGNATLLSPESGAVPALSSEASAALRRLVLDHATAFGEKAVENRRLREEAAVNWQLHQYERKTVEALERHRQELLNSKAMRLASSYWRLRANLREAAEEVGRRAPERVRPVLKRLAGVQAPHGSEVPDAPRQVDPEAVERARGQLQEVLDRYPNLAGIVVYPPSIGWNTSLFQRPQQMALAFARLGYLVLYGVDDREGIGDEVVQRADRVHLYPVSWAMAEAIGMIPEPITVSYVYNFAWTKQLDRPRIVFEHIDELEVFTTTHGIEDLRNWYEEAIEGADLVVASARDLLTTVKRRRNDAILCPNGVDYPHFANYVPGDPPEDIAEIVATGRPIIGYYGALAEWVDYELIDKSIRELGEFEFVFIGPDYDGSIRRQSELFARPNIHWLGVKDYQELPAYLHHFDVATIPFIVSDVTHSVSPLKLFEYMAGGRPVVTPPLRECAFYEAVLVASDPDDYVAKLKQGVQLRHDDEHQALLRRTARANTWDMRVGSIIDALAKNRAL